MNVPDLSIAKVSTVAVWDHSPGGGVSVFPGLSISEAFPTLWNVLHQIHEDRIRESNEYNYADYKGDNPEVDRAVFLLIVMEDLKPRYIHCLFSYINFFFTLEIGFSNLYGELKRFQAHLGLGLKIPKKPRAPENYHKLRRIRNHTVVHWGGPDKNADINSAAGRMWGFSVDSNADTLLALRVGASSIAGADDRYLEPISEIHRNCADYLKAYDDLCAGILEEVASRLPTTVGDIEYKRAGADIANGEHSVDLARRPFGRDML